MEHDLGQEDTAFILSIGKGRIQHGEIFNT